MKAYYIPIVIAIVSAVVIAFILNPSAIQDLIGRIKDVPNFKR